jgi:cell division septum initiation protein DivIVA
MSIDSQNLKIFAILEQIEQTIENSPRPKIGGGNKRLVDMDEIMDLMGDLKVTIPEDIRRANSVMLEAQNMTDNAADHARDIVEKAQRQADKLVADANSASQQMVVKAKDEYERLVSEDEIYLEAQKRAQLLAAKAEFNANVVYENAKLYADQVLQDLERFLVEYEQLVKRNRKDLDARAPQPQPVQSSASTASVPRSAAPVAAPIKHAAKPASLKKQPEEDLEDDDFDEDEEEEKSGGFLSGLFGHRKKKIEDEDFEDEE